MAQLWNREALYSEVWTDPVVTVAMRYGVSGNAIAKVCKKLRIPLPGRGYWAKKAYGHSVRQIALPPMKDVPELWQPTPKPALEKAPMDEEVESIEQRLKNGDFEPSVHGRKCRPEIEAIRKAMFSRRAGMRDHYRLGFRSDELDLRVSKACLDRAIELLKSIMDVAEEIGATIKISGKQGNSKTSFSHGGFDIAFCIREKLRMIKRTPSTTSSFGYATTFEPTGVLAVEILDWTGNIRGQWQDTGKLRIEAHVPGIIAGLVKISILHRRREEQWQKERLIAKQREIEREQRAQRVAQEQARVKQLIEDAEHWQLAKRIRDYISALEEHDAASRTEAQIVYLRWAKQQADRIDPLTPSPPSIVD